MKKAVVLEVKKGYAAVLADDGTFLKIHRKCSVGETIFISDKEIKRNGSGSHFRTFRTAAAAAVLLLLTTGAGGYYTTATAASYAYVTMDDGSAIEISMNHFGKVIRVEANSGDAKMDDLVEMLYQKGIKYDSIDHALEKTTEVLKEGGYLKEKEKPGIQIHADSDKTFEKMKQKAKEGGFEVERHEGRPGDKKEFPYGGERPENDMPEKEKQPGIGAPEK